MPHYPDEIEYSDKYTDDHYEYRHVILPRDVYKKLARNRILSESVPLLSFRNGEASEFSNQEAGFITSCTDLNLTSFFSEDPKALTLKPDCLLPDLLHLPTLLSIELMILINYLQNGKKVLFDTETERIRVYWR